MLASSHTDAERIADHYDRLNQFYIDSWGLHRHHACWESGRESTEEAIACMAWKIIGASAVTSGGRVADIGCGTGGLAWLLADTRNAEVAAYTLSKEEKQTAEEQGLGHEMNVPDFYCCDWLDNDLPDEWADAVLFIESLSHMAARDKAVEEAARVLKPGGRLVLADWMISSQSTTWKKKKLLEPMRRSGRLAGLVTMEENRESLKSVELEVLQVIDLSDRVSKTWSVLLTRLAGKVLLDGAYRKLLWESLERDPALVLTPPCVLLAYAFGCLKYALLIAEK